LSEQLHKIQWANRRNKDKINTTNTQIHDRLLSWLGTDISVKSGGAKLAL